MRCKHWDCGWCYSREGPENGECIGTESCSIYQKQVLDFYKESYLSKQVAVKQKEGSCNKL